MAFTRWSYGRAGRTVRRGLSGFDVRLRSACPGIGFAARITATVVTRPPYPGTGSEIVSAVRESLRRAAGDISITCDPADLATARDVIAKHLLRPRALPTDPPVEFRAGVTLDLLPGDRAAVGSLLSAQREQATADILRRQKAEAMAAELADPAVLLLRRLERDTAEWSGLAALVEDAEKVAALFARFRPERERTIEHELLEIARDFVGSFPDAVQKRMLCALFAGGMESAGRPLLAAKVLALLQQLTPAPTKRGA